MIRTFWTACLVLALGGCASDRYLANRGHELFRRREWTQAAAAFGAEAAKPGANQVLFLLDQATALFAAHKYDEAIPVFLQAEKLTEIKDYTSISEEVGTLVTSGNVRGYKGEDYEKVLVNVYLALSYAAVGKLEDAQVEARKINLILYRMIHDGKRNYEESPFARYFAAMLWEADRNWNDAYIDYKKTWELDPAFPDIGRDLIGASKKMGFTDELQKWKAQFPEAKPRWEHGQQEPVRGVSSDGELVAVFEKGLSPVKVPRNDENSSLPRYMVRYSEVGSARLKINGETAGTFVPALDITKTSTRYLEDRIGRMMAAKVAGIAVKGALAVGVAKLSKSEDLGQLAFLALLLSDRADLRSWRTLPGELQMARVPLRAGTYDVEIEVLGWSGEVLRKESFPKVEIKTGQKKFIVGR